MAPKRKPAPVPAPKVKESPARAAARREAELRHASQRKEAWAALRELLGEPAEVGKRKKGRVWQGAMKKMRRTLQDMRTGKLVYDADGIRLLISVAGGWSSGWAARRRTARWR